MIHITHNTRLRSTVDCFYRIVVDENTIFFNIALIVHTIKNIYIINIPLRHIKFILRKYLGHEFLFVRSAQRLFLLRLHTTKFQSNIDFIPLLAWGTHSNLTTQKPVL